MENSWLAHRENTGLENVRTLGKDGDAISDVSSTGVGWREEPEGAQGQRTRRVPCRGGCEVTAGLEGVSLYVVVLWNFGF